MGAKIIGTTRPLMVLLAVVSLLAFTACTTPPTSSAHPAPSVHQSSATPTPSPTEPTPTPAALTALDAGLIPSENLCIALAAADLDLLTPIGVGSSSTLSTDQAGENGRCYISDAPASVSLVLDFGPNLSGTAEWLQPTWPSPCIGESSSEIVALGGYETARSYCTEYPVNPGSARHYTAVATTPGGGVDCRLTTDGNAPAIEPATINTICAQAFERLQGLSS